MNINSIDIKINQSLVSMKSPMNHCIAAILILGCNMYTTYICRINYFQSHYVNQNYSKQ